MLISVTDYLSLNPNWEAAPIRNAQNYYGVHVWSPTIVKIFDDESKYNEYENIITLLGNL